MAFDAALSALGGDAPSPKGRGGVPEGWGASPQEQAVRDQASAKILKFEKTEGAFSGAINALSEPESQAATAKAKPAQLAKPIEAGVTIPRAGSMGTVGSDLAAAATNAVSGIGASIIGGWRGLAALATGGTLEDAANATREEQERRTYQPQTEGGRQAVEVLSSPANPMNWPAALAKKTGEVAQDAGASPGVSTAIETGINAIPALFLRGAGSKVVSMPKLSSGEVAAIPAKAGGEVLPTATVHTLDTPTVIRQRLAAKQAATVPLAEVGASEAPPVPQIRPAAVAASGPVVKATVAAEARRTPDLAAVVDSEPVKGGVPPAEHAARAQVLSRIGLNTARNSALEGDAMNGATDFHVGKYTGEPAGKAAFEQFAAENAALKGHAAKIIKETGGTPGSDLEALAARGQAIAAPLDALKDFFQKATTALYKEADTRAQGAAAVQPDGFGKLLNTESVFAGKAPNQSLGAGIRSYLREQGIMDKEGALRAISAQEAEGVKQYINSQYSHETSGLSGKIKGALDQDVFKSAGEDVYAAARALYRKQKQTLDNPNGIAKVMEFDPQNPMNRATAFEKIPDTVANLSKAQYDHLLATLRGVPQELQPLAQQALKEIRAQWAEKLLRKGTGTTPDAQWNAPQVTEAIKLNSGKITNAFKETPELISKIKDLQEAGNILRVNPAYPGASAQGANAVKRGLMSNFIRPIGASAGGTLGAFFGPAGAAGGAWVGDAVGARAAQSVGEKAALKKWAKGTTPLKDVAP